MKPNCQFIQATDGALTICTISDDSIARSFGYKNAAEVIRSVRRRMGTKARQQKAERGIRRQERHQVLIRMREAGQPITAIAKALGMTRQNVASFLKRHRPELRRRRPPAQAAGADK